MRTVRLTREMLKRIVVEEASKFGDMSSTKDAAKDTEEVEADEYADSVEKQLDFVKALKIEESRLIKRLEKVRESKSALVAKLRKKF